MLKIKSAKKLAKDLYIKAYQSNRIIIQINLKALTKDLNFFDLIIKGSSKTVIIHMSTQQLKVPLVLSNSQI